MIPTAKRSVALLLALVSLLGIPGLAPAATSPLPEGSGQAEPIGRTPPRLSYVDGAISFWRPGAPDWAPAQLNTPLAPGDELYVAANATLEMQVGARAFVRASNDSQFGIANQEPDFLQLKLTSGHLALDLRSIEPGRGVELDTPNAAFTLDHPGYFRIDVTSDRTSFIVRRAGQATMTSASGQSSFVAASEEVLVEGGTTPSVQSYVAPDLDAWDQWNYTRTDHLFEALSARYVSPGTYGVDELDHHGAWRVVPQYGAVWLPDGVPAGWAPYTTGKWILDPFYGWTWVDTAPWGWAPYHYGRWVFFNGFWAWTPGPVVVRPGYAPALVAFFSAPGVRVGVGPAVSWVALGWGEPVVPWWGRSGFVDRPWWGGWGGPHVVNNVVVNRTSVVNVNNITVYRNVEAPHAVVAVQPDHFVGRPVSEARISGVDVRRLEPARGRLNVRPEPASFVADRGTAVRPPAPTLERSVVATRPPARSAAPTRTAPAPIANPPAPRLVQPPRMSATASPPRPPFGQSQAERERPSMPPRFEHAAVPSAPPRPEPPHAPTMPSPAARAQTRAPAPVAIPAPHASPRALPGEPANRVSPHRSQAESDRRVADRVGPARPAGAALPAVAGRATVTARNRHARER